MKQFSFLVAASCLLLGATASQAQTSISFGPRLGGNLTRFSYSGNNTGLDKVNSEFGVQAGATANISFGNWAFQPSLLFSQKGAELLVSGIDVSGGYSTRVNATISPTLHYIELPLNVVYTSEGDHGFQVFAGPYLALGVGGGGSYSATVTSTNPLYSPYNGTYPGSLTVEYGSNESSNNNANSSSTTVTFTARRFDAGLSGGIGYRLGPVQAQLGYSLGLLNIVPNDEQGNDTGSKAYNRGFQLAATYFFAKK